MSKIAVVTGGNKGIGFAIVKGLCEKFQGDVYLTARDVSRGEEAVKKLNTLGFKPLFHQLDITDESSVIKFKDYIESKHGGIDVLINNAAIAFKHDAKDPFDVQAEETLRVNYFSLVKVCEILFPIIRQNGRVVNLSSSAGVLSRIPSEELRNKFIDPTLSVEGLSKLMESFVRDVKENVHQEDRWGSSTYVVSKVGVSALSLIQQKNFDNETPNRNISVNAVHPGYVDTDMTSHKGPLTIEEGAKSSLYCALEDHGLRGKYVWFDCSVKDWQIGRAHV